jgi:phosphoglycerate dehydrogenase-like enzyme
VLRLALPDSVGAAKTRLPPDVEVAWYSTGADCPNATPDAEVLWLTMWRTDEIEAALRAGERLRWVSTTDAGVNTFPFKMFRERGIRLTNGRGLHAIPIAEYVVMAMLAAAKGLPALLRAQDRTEWLPSPPARAELCGTRALIVGYGDIGRALAERLRPFGVDVTGVRRRPAPAEAGVLGPDDWRERLGEFDWLILSAPETRMTRHMVGAAELSAMKRTAWLLNVARAPLIDQDALEAALQRRAIGGAYLDLTDPEPLPPDSPLWRMPNVLITPHSSQASTRFSERATDLFLDNLNRYREGRALRNVVDLEAGY